MKEDSVFAEQESLLAPRVARTPTMLLDRQFRIRGLNGAFEHVSQRSRSDLLGNTVFDVFPDNPADPGAGGSADLTNSLEWVLRRGHSHNMWVQRYDIPVPGGAGEFVRRVWSPVNSPIFDQDGRVIGVAQRVEDITTLDTVLSALAGSAETTVEDDVPHRLESLGALGIVLARYRQGREVLAAENRDLRTAMETRAVIEQAKGILMGQRGCGPDEAFRLLTSLSQSTNRKVRDVAAALVDHTVN
ncbi:ANTAR domain-containing protein [Rhodococcus opacus]|uniref:Histidine kinase n=1 Tax=Rhodococcus opacus TaxID=37919 RepID=A0A2S8IJ18_RHOOP|nr:ANTAR domain-containing protein [Rhodococcus opacus]PQP14766.1 histidine kinase [Rhodococcus opacus]